jgi:hypothetical protein
VPDELELEAAELALEAAELALEAAELALEAAELDELAAVAELEAAELELPEPPAPELELDAAALEVVAALDVDAPEVVLGPAELELVETSPLLVVLLARALLVPWAPPTPEPAAAPPVFAVPTPKSPSVARPQPSGDAAIAAITPSPAEHHERIIPFSVSCPPSKNNG